MAEQSRHYFDWAATAPPLSNDNLTFSESDIFGNPSSVHREGKAAREALEKARSACAKVLGVKPETLYFTSGGTESNNIVLYSFLKRKGNGRILYSAVEHPSIRDNCSVLEYLGVPVASIAAEKDGRISPETFGRTLETNPD
ncbi:MAG: aminotransferase class V-fold PLP-dependent enzyme [Treponema sp.]|nr:aminotransferase class V-fold PLP-dependent enzyme [Treponema sp.]